MEGEDRSTRRSARSTRGVAPPRLGFEEERSMRSSRRSGGGQSRSSYETQRRVLEAEKRLLEKELELVRLAQDEASSSGQGAKGSSSPKMASEVFAEELIEGHEADAAVDAGQGDEAGMGEVEVAHLPEHAVAVSHDPEPHAVPSPSVAGTVSAHTSRSLPVAVRTESEVARASTNTEQANLSGLRVQQEFVLKEKRYQRELSEAQSIADAEQRRVAKLNKDLASARADLSSLQAENRRVTQEKEVCEAERDVSERELRELQPHLERLEREHQEGRMCLEDLRDQNDRLLTRAEQVSAEQHAQRAELLDKLERLRAENASLQQRADRGGGRGPNEQRTQRAELLVQLDQLRGENDRLRRRADHDQYTAQCSSAQQQELRSRIQSDQEPEEIVKTHQAAGSTVKGLQQDGRGQADEGLQSQLSRLTA
ncbi:cilia- and flagella-associated protein 58-like [Sycon ciliatum]|uniref:cilia- and flagella-associated protein 58-like n=1 Tax=Sycon ciliatum TaxID=27933 RepID=UPI0031F648B1